METAQYADEEDNATDHYPRRLRGSALPENRWWWIPGLKCAWDTWEEARAGWKGIAIGVLATASAFACMDGERGGAGGICHLRQ